jgi:hypothetical protein
MTALLQIDADDRVLAMSCCDVNIVGQDTAGGGECILTLAGTFEQKLTGVVTQRFEIGEIRIADMIESDIADTGSNRWIHRLNQLSKARVAE